jgi:hypothetical protein
LRGVVVEGEYCERVRREGTEGELGSRRETEEGKEELRVKKNAPLPPPPFPPPTLVETAPPPTPDEDETSR